MRTKLSGAALAAVTATLLVIGTALSATGLAATTDEARAATSTSAALDQVASYPVVKGFAKGRTVRYLLQEVSDPDVADLLSEVTGFPVPYTPKLRNVPAENLAKLYIFENGVAGPNPFGFQANVLDSVPGDARYSPLWIHTFVKWKRASTPRVLRSVPQIKRAAARGTLKLTPSDLIINCPVLPEGESTFPTVTGFVDEQEVDYLLQDVSDEMTAELMAEITGYPIPYTPKIATLPARHVAKLYIFENGVTGPNPFGFQPNVIGSIPGERGYSPLWIHVFVSWKAGSTPRTLMSVQQIKQAARDAELTLEPSDLIINCPVLPMST